MNTIKTGLGLGAMFLLIALALAPASPGPLLAQGCGACGSPCNAPCCSPCEPVKCTVLVPQWVVEHQTRAIVRYRPEIREQMVTVYRDVPVTHTIQEEYTVMVPQTRTRTVVDTIDRPIFGDIQLRTVSMTPQVEPRQGTSTITRMVPVQEERTVYETTGCAACGSTAPSAEPPPPPPPEAAAQPAAVTSCGACNTCPRKICLTSWKPVSQQETVQYAVTRFQPNSRVETVSFYEYRPEQRSHEETYVVQVPETRTRPREITVIRRVAQQQPEQYTVMVPYEAHVQVPVLACRYVERTVTVR